MAAVLWPLDPNVPVNYPDLPGFSMNGLSPAQWVAFVLDHEAKPCQFGGSGRITKEGDDYIVPSTFKDHFNKTSLELGGGRPYNLPAWPKN